MEPQEPGSLSSTLDLEATMVEQHSLPAVVVVPPLNGSDSAHQINLDWPLIVIGFCFSWAVAIALQSFQTCAGFSVSSHLLSFAMVGSVAALFVSKYISPKFPDQAQMLEHVGVLFGVTAFFFAITVPFSLCLKLIYWTIYALSLLVIFLCIRR